MKQFIILFLISFLSACQNNSSFKLNKHFHEQDFLWGTFEIDQGSGSLPISSTAQIKRNLEILSFKTLLIDGQSFYHIQGCLFSQLIEGRFRLSWRIFEEGESCENSNREIKIFESLKGYDLVYEKENFSSLSVSFLKLTLRYANQNDAVIRKYYLPNLAIDLKPTRTKELFASPFLKSAVTGVQFEMNGRNFKSDLVNVAQLTKNLPSSLNQEWIKCAERDNQCRAVFRDQCHLCQQGFTTVMYGDCSTSGVRFCGPLPCGSKGELPCHLGRSHIDNDDFKGCSELSEEWLCASGLILDCSAKPYPLCR